MEPLVKAEQARLQQKQPKRRGRPRAPFVTGYLIGDDSTMHKPKGARCKGLGHHHSTTYEGDYSKLGELSNQHPVLNSLQGLLPAPQVTGIGHLMEGYPAESAQHQAIGHFEKVFGVPAYLQVRQPAPAVSFHQRTY